MYSHLTYSANTRLFRIASYTDFKRWKFEAKFKGDCAHYMKT